MYGDTKRKRGNEIKIRLSDYELDDVTAWLKLKGGQCAVEARDALVERARRELAQHRANSTQQQSEGKATLQYA